MTLVKICDLDDITVSVTAADQRIVSVADVGTPAIADLPSANPGQTITFESDAEGIFDTGTVVTVPTIDTNGVTSTTDVTPFEFPFLVPEGVTEFTYWPRHRAATCYRTLRYSADLPSERTLCVPMACR